MKSLRISRFDSIIRPVKRYVYPLIAAAVVALDQLTKYLVRANMQPGDRIPVIGDWMSIYYPSSVEVLGLFRCLYPFPAQHDLTAL